VESVKTKALICGTDLEKDVWEKLESGRMEWLQAAGNAHTIKVTLRAAVEADGEAVGDVRDAMMVWMYALALNIKSLAGAVNKWAAKVEMEVREGRAKRRLLISILLRTRFARPSFAPPARCPI
jgi:hypothetical protein